MNTPANRSYLDERIGMLTSELASKRRSMNWSSNLTLVLGLIAIIALSGYFGYGYFRLNEITQPTMIVDAAYGQVDQYASRAREMAASEIRSSAPTWAKQASQQLVDKMPTLREKAEAQILDYMEKKLLESQQMTEERFQKILSENRAEFEEAIEMMVKPGGSKGFVSKIYPIIEKKYAPEMRDTIKEAISGLELINRQLETLARSDDLNPIQEQQKHLLGLTRLLRTEK